MVNCQLEKDRIGRKTTQFLDDHLNVILRKQETRGDLADFLHGACFLPVISTFLKAVEKNHFTTWPDLITRLIRKHLTKKKQNCEGTSKPGKEKLTIN